MRLATVFRLRLAIGRILLNHEARHHVTRPQARLHIIDKIMWVIKLSATHSGTLTRMV